MKLSYQWLQEYVDCPLSPEELAHELTMLGLEIEGIEKDGQDSILELSITPNRGDCLSLIGIAREVAMITDSELRLPTSSTKHPKTHPSATNSWEINIKTPDACPRYSACIIKGLKIGPSPEWLAKRLEKSGVRPINNVVDVTNYILLEWGQPMHAFDLSHLSGNKVIVRQAENGEKFTTLDEQEHELDEKMLVISDSQKAVALGGVMGGLNSEVTVNTQDILLECAYFNPLNVRHTSRKLGLATESSFRFERGTDGANLLQPLQHAIALIQELAGGSAIEPIIDNYPTPLPQIEINLRFKRVNQVLGTKLTDEKIKTFINKLYFQIISEQADRITVKVPSFRQEIDREIDLIEEIARLYGYDNICTTIPRGELPKQAIQTDQIVRDKIRSFLTSCGLWEAINFSFTSQASYSRINKGRGALCLSNPLGLETGVLRSTLLPGLLENIFYNLNRQVPDLKLFEIGHCFWHNADNSTVEKSSLAFALTGNSSKPGWNTNARAIDFYDLKGIVDSLLKYLGFTTWRWERGTISYLHPGQSAEIFIGDTKIGQGGRIHPDKQRELELQQQVFVWEFDLEQLLFHLPQPHKVASLPRYPATFRDLAIVVDISTPAAQVENVIRNSGGNFLKDLQLFDVYTGNQVAKGKKSLAFALTYQSEEGTLEEDQINIFQNNIIKALEDKLSASLRE